MEPMRRLRKAVTGLAVIGLTAAGILLATPQAQAIPAVADAETVTADALPTVQINGVVWRQKIAGSKVFAGGQFTTARPAGAAPGTQEVARNNLLAYDLDTGVLDSSFAPNVNGKVKAMAVSPDGSTVYIGGSFTQVNGQSRNRAAAFNVATGALLNWNPGFNSSINALVATDTAVYAGGMFSRVGSTARPSLAAVSPSGTGTLLAWAPTTDAIVQDIAITSDQSRIVVAGNFDNINGASAKGLGAVNTADGSSLSFAINNVIQNSGAGASFLSLQMDKNDNVYGTGYAYGASGPFFEGVFAANAMTGAVNWLADCHGDSYDAVEMNGSVYAASHHHYCENINGFGDTDPRVFWQRADAFTVQATGTVKNNGQGGYPNFAGNPAPSFVSWFPDVASGTYTGQSQGPWTLTANDEYLIMGGEFPMVNGIRQQGIARFAIRSKATNKQGPVGTADALTPKLFQTSSSTVRIGIPTTWDRDDLKLTYQVYREGVAQPVATATNEAVFWNTQSLAATDSGLTAGQTYRYRVRVTDSTGNSLTSPYASIDMQTNVSAYPAGVFSDGASHYWQLGATNPFADLAGNMSLNTVGTITTDTAGAYTGSTASRFSGTTAVAGGATQTSGPKVFSVEAWFKTTTNRGGKIVGFGSSSTGSSGSYDRHIYMSNNGQVTFGVYDGSTRTITTPSSYNDGSWHHVVGTLSSTGSTLFVDGARIGSDPGATAQDFSGYWRIGGDNIGSWPGQPTSSQFAGSIDDVAVYPTSLTAAQIRSHYAASGRTFSVQPAPTDTYGKTIYDDAPVLQWRVNETSGNTAADASGNETAGTVSGGVTWGTSSPVAPGSAITLNGSDGLVATRSAVPSPNVYSSEIWFNTTNTVGGKIIGFGNQPSGSSSNYDRHVYMLPNGQLVFGLWSGTQNTITSNSSYNDGAWHHVVATQGTDGMKLYVDGTLVGTNSRTTGDVYNGYWRVGGDTEWAGARYFAGKVDEAAVYDYVLTADQARAHYRASGAATNVAPSAQIGTPACTYLECTFTGSGTDPDGTIASYAWDFGDGATSTQQNPSHTFTQAGTFTVKLTVTDDRGATGTKETTVTVASPPPNQLPQASFTVTNEHLSVSVDASGSSDPDGSIESYAWDFGDGTTETGKTASHTYSSAGSKVITLTVTDNRSGTATTTRTVTATEPPNQLPQASFTASVDGSTVTVNGSASSDPDGSITSYAWNFGDNTTGTGASATHTYTSTGSFTITLTVTDNRGGTATTTRNVEILGFVVADDFTRTASNWGTADTGGTWTYTTPARFRTDGSSGVITLPAAKDSGTAYLNNVSLRDLDLTATLEVPTIPTGAGVQTTMIVRRVDATTDYRVTYQLHSDGYLRLNITKRVGGVSTSLGDVKVSTFTYSAGEKINIKLLVTGNGTTTIAAKTWKAGTAEPAAASMSRTDSTAELQTAGSFAVTAYLAASATEQVVLKLDNLRIKQA